MLYGTLTARIRVCFKIMVFGQCFVACWFCHVISYLTSAIINDICTHCFLFSLHFSSVPLFASLYTPAPSLLPVFPLLYCVPSWGVCICRGARLEPRHFSFGANLCSHRAALFLALFCVVWFCRACVRHCGVSPSLDTVPDSLRMQVYQWQDVCLQRRRECGCLP